MDAQAALVGRNDIIYFIMTDRFFGVGKKNDPHSDAKIHGGTLDCILTKLDYLKTLGITAIWVTPVYENIAEHNGSEPYHYYWPNDFKKMDGRLIDGSKLPKDACISTFKMFVDKCNAAGIKVVLDMVVNHAGYGCKTYALSWFNVGGQGDVKGELAGLPDFNHDNPEVRDFHIDTIAKWVSDGGATNIRMDTVKHVEHSFWYYFKSEVRGHRDVCLIGEVLCEGKDDVSKLLEFQNYHDFDSIFDFPLCTGLRSTFVYDGSLRYWLARPRLSQDEAPGILDYDNPLEGGYRNCNELVTLLDNHDLERRIMSHARTKHPGDGDGLAWAIRVTKLCLGALLTMRGIPQLYYGTEIGLEGWKQGGNDCDLRRDFPWDVIGEDNRPRKECAKERQIHDWTRDLILLRKSSPALMHGATVTLWVDDLAYAFLRLAVDDVVLVVINNGYQDMPYPLRIALNTSVLPDHVIKTISSELLHWGTRRHLSVVNGMAEVSVPAKSIAIYCREAVLNTRDQTDVVTDGDKAHLEMNEEPVGV